MKIQDGKYAAFRLQIEAKFDSFEDTDERIEEVAAFQEFVDLLANLVEHTSYEVFILEDK